MSNPESVRSCPNCRAPWDQAEDQECPQCGWLPLRGTELQFVEDDEVVCRQCGARRPYQDVACPHCGNSEVLESLSSSALTFRISNMIFCTTLVAICCALARFSLGLGVIALFLSGASVFHTAVLIGERRRHRYPLSSAVTWKLFGCSVMGVTVGAVVFCATAIGGGFILGGLFSPFTMGSVNTAVLILVIMLFLSHAITGYFVLPHVSASNVGAGAALGLVSGVFACLLEPLMYYKFMGWLLLLPLWTMFAGALPLAARRGGSIEVKGYLWGHCAVLTLLGITLGLDDSRPSFTSGFLLFGFSLIPTLVTVIVLQRLWSWDDAFPRAYHFSSPHRQHYGPRDYGPRDFYEPTLAEGIEFDEPTDEGIEFP